MSYFTCLNCAILRIFYPLSVHSSVTTSQRITYPLQTAPMNTRSIFGMPFKLQDLQTPRIGGKPQICTTTFIGMHPVNYFSVGHACFSSNSSILLKSFLYETTVSDLPGENKDSQMVSLYCQATKLGLSCLGIRKGGGDAITNIIIGYIFPKS